MRDCLCKCGACPIDLYVNSRDLYVYVQPHKAEPGCLVVERLYENQWNLSAVTSMHLGDFPTHAMLLMHVTVTVTVTVTVMVTVTVTGNLF